MTVALDCVQRSATQAMVPLEDRFEVIKEIGDGSFGSVVLARVRGAGASVARRGTMVNPHVRNWHSTLSLIRTDCNQDDEEDF